MTFVRENFLSAPIAHRAFHDIAMGRPENSRSAVKAAINAGYGIEIDVQLTADGRAVVFHDYQLDRLTDHTGTVREHSVAQLSAMTLTGSSEGIPTFSEVLDLVAGQVPLLVELKDQDGAMGPAVGPLERDVANGLKAYDGPVAVMSFNPHSVARMRELAPAVPRGLTTCAYAYDATEPLSDARRNELRNIPDYDKVGATFISHDANDLGRQRVRELKRAGAVVLCWTIRSKQAEAKARKIADNITFEGYPAEIPAH